MREEPPARDGERQATLSEVAELADLALVLRHLRRRDARRRGGSPRSYRELAEATGWSLGVIGGYFSGKILPPTDRFDVLVRLLGAAPQELAGLATARDRVEERRRRAAGPTAGPPAQLPADLPTFTGRTEALHRLDVASGVHGGPAVPVVALTGTAGVGKSALAVRWAHRARGRFPDGQIFVNLRGYAAEPPLRPVDALAGVLRTLGVPPAQVPVDLDEAGGLFRTMLAGRRMLLLLDDARGPDQVRPLLPGEPGCMVLVTSRDQLLGLRARDGACGIAVDVLGAAEAHALLAEAVGAGRLAAEPAAAADLARACGYLPLALRIVAANLIGRPDLTVADHLRRLTGDDALSSLELDGDPETAVRGAFEPSYRALPEPARALFRLLGLVPGADVAQDAAAALAGLDEPDARRALDTLTRAHLVERAQGGRVALHDLLRRYAAERCAGEVAPDARRAAVGRLLEWYVAGADGAVSRLYSERLRLPRPDGARPAEFATDAQARTWLEAERGGLLAAAGRAAGHGRPDVAVRIADALRGYATQCLPTLQWIELAEAALAAAETLGDPQGRAAAHLGLAEARWRQGDHDATREQYARAAGLSRDADWLGGEVAALGNLGVLCLLTGRVAEAVDHLGRALVLGERAARPAGQGATLGSLGVAYRQLGELSRSVEHLERALAIFRAVDSRGGVAIALDNLGETHLAAGRVAAAVACLDEALTLFREMGSRINEAVALRGLGAAHLAAGDVERARACAQQAYEVCAEVPDPRIEAEVTHTLAAVRATRDTPAAMELYLRALHLARTAGHRHSEVETLVALAELQQRAGRTEAARGWAAQAAALARSSGYRPLLDRADAVLGRPVHTAPPANERNSH